MGYSEFGGGGSVLWHVRHGRVGSGVHGRDPNASVRGGSFIIFLNGKEIGRDRIDFNNPRQVQIVWDPQTPADRAGLAVESRRDRFQMAISERRAATARRRGTRTARRRSTQTRKG